MKVLNTKMNSLLVIFNKENDRLDIKNNYNIKCNLIMDLAR